jgi:thiol:disulfide interchange protein DsbD
MALPYVILSIFPHWLRHLPRPGPWMDTFKKAMSFPMFAVAAYFVWVFGRQTGMGGLSELFKALLGAALAAWIYGHWAALHRSGKVRWIVGHVGAGLVLAASLWYAWVGSKVVPVETGASTVTEGWAAYDNGALAAHLDAGRPVFLDFTADWCVSCKANEKLVLDTATVREAVRANGVALLQADWTRKDKAIADALASFRRSSVPVYVIYSPHAGRKPLLLPPVITPQMVKDAIERASKP